MKKVTYLRCDFHEERHEKRISFLYQFLLDVPYLMIRGVIPSLDAVNEVLMRGGGDGGMGPGAISDYSARI
ncbi:hypothetical protein QA601_16640 [Chitinispirillales bacterium ANBcel5]|uniref:hypothetical protein n=1 Tax=Cellulosispirillum alkaliphilum TaxID=3039283 RepID=UPI002A4FEA76|nr:hypothetical protein [Chitinispirillales bacterium ANBcel5]